LFAGKAEPVALHINAHHHTVLLQPHHSQGFVAFLKVVVSTNGLVMIQKLK
jgi:hypothetical protein